MSHWNRTIEKGYKQRAWRLLKKSMGYLMSHELVTPKNLKIYRLP